MNRHIALLAYSCDPERGTEPGVGWQWASHLAAAGHRVELITRHDPATLARLHAAVAAGGADGRLRLHTVPEPRVGRLELALTPAPLRPGWSAARRYLGWLAAVESYLDGGPAVDLVHHVTYGSLSGGSALPRGRPALVFGPVSGAQRAPRALRPLLGADRRQEAVRDLFAGAAPRRPGRARRTLAAADLVLATNSDTARLARSRGAGRVEMMLADGLSADYLANTAGPRDLARPVVLWVGSLRAIKVPTLALAAFRHLLDALPAARLRLVGDGPLRAAVEGERDRLGLGDSVELAGRVPWPAMRRQYDDAAVLLFTSVRDAFGAQSLEGWGRALPSVGFAQHGLADFAPPDGTILVPPARPALAARRLADALRTVLADPDRHRRMSVAALDRARAHTWPAKVARAGALYDELLDPVRSGSAAR